MHFTKKKPSEKPNEEENGSKKEDRNILDEENEKPEGSNLESTKDNKEND